jgi:hypothetical protein
VFADDPSFARWLLANVHRVTEIDRAYLRDLLMTPSTNELLRISGLDLAALRSLVRNEPVNPEHQEGLST